MRPAAIGHGVAEVGEAFDGVDQAAADEPSWNADPRFPEATLVALWLLGRVPPAALPLPLLRAGRAGHGPGPDVREAVLVAPSGVPIAGDVEMHLRASDFARHGHASDPAYAGVILHVCWIDDRPERGTGTVLPPAVMEPRRGAAATRLAPTVELSRWMTVAEVERAVSMGPLLAGPCLPPCAASAGGHRVPEDTEAVARGEQARVIALVREEGRRRLAEMSWRAWRLIDRYGVEGALSMLLARAVAGSAGRVKERPEQREALVAGIMSALGRDPLRSLRGAALAPTPMAARRALVASMRATPSRAGAVAGRARAADDTGETEGRALGPGRAAEVAWNAALPLLAACAAAYDDVPLARAIVAVADTWPAPAPYGRTRSLAAVLARPTEVRHSDAPPETGGPETGERGVSQSARVGPRPSGGALYAQGLLHLQDLWCSRGGCGVCPLSRSVAEESMPEPGAQELV